MVNSFIFSQETIASIQKNIETLEKCLNEPDPRDETIAALYEFANSRQISLSQIQEELTRLQSKLSKFSHLGDVLKEQVKQGQLPVIIFVKYNLLFKEIFEQFSDLIFFKQGKQIFFALITDAENLYRLIKNEAESEFYNHNEKYILEESIKYAIQALIKAGLLINILAEEKLKNLALEDITPQQSEAMLISLASTKKWDWVYRNLA
ncbi:hypothetical protein H6G74_11500 [Nostoc spongiaeforme FACHB-130]|uniref:Uncharacterized protein n=1 Tax=Nostoc spongiaeforme FACHB-130 TaxID=1357510 RepID=A0ABR8FUI9_9NOSO|nr:hypothetical protein [Nostoc spongiaeforme]MBD2594951.1 hypothetical protein [Nostoc spongiaeforme FACHB-130]